MFNSYMESASVLCAKLLDKRQEALALGTTDERKKDVLRIAQQLKETLGYYLKLEGGE